MAEPMPNPGSPAAKKMGCTCPRMDNAHGRGAYLGEDGEPVYWITQGCPLHAPTPEAEGGDDGR